MRKNPAEIAKAAHIKGWHLRDKDHDRFEVVLVPESRHTGKNCALMQSLAEDVEGESGDGFGHFTQICSIDEYRGKRIRMTAWAKSELADDSVARLELCIVGDWGWWCKWNGTFDNLGHNPIRGTTDWKQYALVVDVPQDALCMSFGLLLSGTGKVWLDEFTFEIVYKETPLTGIGSRPTNLNFDESL